MPLINRIAAMKPIVRKGGSFIDSLLILERRGKKESIDESPTNLYIYTFHYIFTKNAICVRIPLFFIYSELPPLLRSSIIFSKTPERRRARVPFDLIEFDRDRKTARIILSTRIEDA